jgi:hypothetical protein
MSAATMAEQAAEWTYEDVRDLINSVCWNFKKQYGGDFDELKSEAHLYYQRAFILHKPKHGPFPQWVRFRIWKNLLDNARQIARTNARHERLPMCANEVQLRASYTPSDFDLAEFMEGLSKDARIVIRLTVNMPWADIHRPALLSGGKPRNFRATIRRALLDLEGWWDRKRVAEAFNEIGDALAAY